MSFHILDTRIKQFKAIYFYICSVCVCVCAVAAMEMNCTTIQEDCEKYEAIFRNVNLSEVSNKRQSCKVRILKKNQKKKEKSTCRHIDTQLLNDIMLIYMQADRQL